MDVGIFFWGVLAGLFCWLIFVSYLIFRIRRQFNHLTKGVTEGNLHDILNKFLDDSSLIRLETKRLSDTVKLIQQEGKTHIQKIGIVRFNPFADTGGNQSFTIAILDSLNNGIVLTSLYARAGGRWYSKEVYGGKGREIVLSKEEEEAIRRAKIIGNGQV